MVCNAIYTILNNVHIEVKFYCLNKTNLLNLTIVQIDYLLHLDVSHIIALYSTHARINDDAITLLQSIYNS